MIFTQPRTTLDLDGGAPSHVPRAGVAALVAPRPRDRVEGPGVAERPPLAALAHVEHARVERAQHRRVAQLANLELQRPPVKPIAAAGAARILEDRAVAHQPRRIVHAHPRAGQRRPPAPAAELLEADARVVALVELLRHLGGVGLF